MNRGQADISLLILILLFLVAMAPQVHAQEEDVVIDSSYVLTSDTLMLHDQVIEGESIEIKNGEEHCNFRFLNELLGQNAVLIERAKLGDTIQAKFKILPFKGIEYFMLKDTLLIRDAFEQESPFVFKPGSSADDVLDFGTLDKRGSISRGILVGNAQDLSVNSDLNLQLSGKLTDRLSLIANISDDNVPIQADGNTQQLQEFDQVFIKIYDDKNSLTAGDFQLRNTDRHFLQYQKKARGASFVHEYVKAARTDSTSSELLKVHGAAAVSRGKFSRNVIQGIEGNQGPYRLQGSDNEQFIIILSGTERIYIDGALLKRGKEFDYVIDYNSAELTFTAKRLITKDRRIVAEFQYSERNYARSMITTGLEYHHAKVQAFVDLISEQDSKNQSLQQELTPEDRLLLSNAGDNLSAALSNQIDSVGYSPDAVLYSLRDSLGYDSVYVYSTDPELAYYQVSYTKVGAGSGFYVQDDFVANGRVFRWVAPDTIGGQLILNGDYAPVLLLVTPKTRRMVSTGIRYQVDSRSRIDAELALSEYDRNSFSSLDAQDDQGHAFKLGMNRSFAIRDTSGGRKALRMLADIHYEQTAAHFTFVERYRPVEYERNWNLVNDDQSGLQHLATVTVGLKKDARNHMTINSSKLDVSGRYQGIRNGLIGAYADDKWTLNVEGSLLSTDGESKTDFMRHRATISRQMGSVILGLKDEHERNEFLVQDTLSAASYEFFDWEAFISSTDTSLFQYKLSFRNREDFRAQSNSLVGAARAQEWGFAIGTRGVKAHRVDITGTYRTLEILRPELISQEPEDNFLGRIEYNGRLFKGGLSLGTFYDVGSGLERKRQFVFLEVAPGQGTHVWNDYDEDGIKDIDEFEIAQFSYEADHIRTYTPTDEFEKTFSNQLGQTVSLDPVKWWRGEKGLKGFLAEFSNQAVWRSERKTRKDEQISIFDPFETDLQDSTLLSSRSSIRNTVYFRKTNPIWGLTHTIQENGNKQLLTNGFDTRRLKEQTIDLRVTVRKIWTLKVKNRLSTKFNRSDYSSNRDYTIETFGVEPSLSYQPNRVLRVTLRGEQTDKENLFSETERASISRIGTEFRYSFISKGNLQVDFDYYGIDYNGVDNTSLAFEMLNGLKPGQNLTWSLRLQRNLSENLELNFTYNGRQSEDVNTIHTGGVQVRAFF